MKNCLLVFMVVLFLISCQKEDQEPLKVIIYPTKALLIFPYENSECNEGINITVFQSTVLFEWNAAENTDEYELILTNLSNADQTIYSTQDTKIPIVLQRATPYAWYVISKSNEVDTVARSETWKFYNAGDGVKSYAPFPAEIITPLMAETINPSSGGIMLDWNGSDVDNDIIGYDVYFGTNDPPELFEGDLSESVLMDVQVASDSIYYWSITTKDEQGNSSESGVFQFKVL